MPRGKTARRRRSRSSAALSAIAPIVRDCKTLRRLQREPDLDVRPVSDRGADVEASAHALDPLPLRAQADVSVAQALREDRRVEAPTVVAHRENELSVVGAEP